VLLFNSASCLLTQFWFSLFCKWTINLPLLFNQKLRFNDLYTPNFLLLHRNLAKPHNTLSLSCSTVSALFWWIHDDDVLFNKTMSITVSTNRSRWWFSPHHLLWLVPFLLLLLHTHHIFSIPLLFILSAAGASFVISTFGCCCCFYQLWLYSKVSLF